MKYTTQHRGKEVVIIAWNGERWMSATERQTEIDRLLPVEEYVNDPNNRQAVKSTDIDVQRQLGRNLRQLDRLRRIHDCEDDLLLFAIEYFSEQGNPGNSGNWEGFDVPNASAAPEFHREICDIMNDVSSTNVNAKIAVAAPRSHAKSSYLSKAFPLHQIVYRKRKYGIVISETPQVSSANMDWLSLQLKYNAKLRADFGPLLSPKQQENPKDNSTEFVAWEPDGEGKRMIAKMEAASTGQALRGRNWNGVRPDLIICDDLEDKRNTNTEQLRKEMRDWFSQVVIPLGDPKGKRTAIVYMGTTVHHDALLMHVLYKRSDFKSRVYRAIIEQPERGDLWEQCRQIYIDRDNPNRKEDAEAFYAKNRDEMERGVVVLWPEVQSVYKLMLWKWDNGSKAFNTEYMNNPIDEESMVFNPDRFTYYDGSGRNFNHSEYGIYMGVDFAMGKTRGDYSALVTIARHRTNGGIFVLDAFGERIHPDVFLKVITERVLRYQPDGIAAEAQAAQEFFVHKLKEALRQAGYPSLQRVKEIHQRTRKELRIEAMLPDIENGTIQFSRKHSLLLEQFELYGSNSHDDLPDALAMALDAAKSGRKQIVDKPSWL